MNTVQLADGGVDPVLQAVALYITLSYVTISPSTYAVATSHDGARVLPVRIVPGLGFIIGLSCSINQPSDFLLASSQLIISSKNCEYFSPNRICMGFFTSSTIFYILCLDQSRLLERGIGLLILCDNIVRSEFAAPIRALALSYILRSLNQ